MDAREKGERQCRPVQTRLASLPAEEEKEKEWRRGGRMRECLGVQQSERKREKRCLVRRTKIVGGGTISNTTGGESKLIHLELHVERRCD